MHRNDRLAATRTPNDQVRPALTKPGAPQPLDRLEDLSAGHVSSLLDVIGISGRGETSRAQFDDLRLAKLVSVPIELPTNDYSAETTEAAVTLAILEELQTMRRIAIVIALFAVPLMSLGIIRLAFG